MTSHKTGTHDEWLAARLDLLQAEKELTRHSDELARRRQELPWVQIGKEYRFETDQGPASLADLFQPAHDLREFFGRKHACMLERPRVRAACLEFVRQKYAVERQ